MSSNKFLADRQSRLGTETAFEVLNRAKALEAQGRDIIHLEIGEPDFDTPQHIIDAAKQALDDGFTHYGPSPGQPQTRQAVADFLSERHGYSIEPDRVIITPGGKPIMFNTIMALIERGDEVIYPNPGFPIYESMINYVGGVAVPMQLREENEFNADIDELERLITPKTKLLIMNSPNNPCGSVMPTADIERIAALANKHDLVVMSDEIYKDIYYEGEHHSITRFPGMVDRTVILDGFSKSYAMTGWRLGYGVVPKWLVDDMVRLAVNIYSCTSVFSQIGAIAALQGSQQRVRDMVKEFTVRRDLVVSELNSLPGVTCLEPKGAFYAFPNITGTGLTSAEFVDRALGDYGVAVLGGTAFGKFGEGFIRVSFANSQENIRDAIGRIRKMLSA